MPENEEEKKSKNVTEKVLNQNEQVRKYVYRGLKEGRILWGRIITSIVSLAVVILVIWFRDSIALFLKSEWTILLSGLSDPTNTAVVANYLLTILILATIGVVFIPFLSGGSTDRSRDSIVSPTSLTR